MMADFNPDAYLATPAGFDPDAYLAQPSVGMDVAKSAGIGPVKGAIGLAGTMGDIRHLAMIPGQKLANYLGVDPEQTAKMQQLGESVMSKIGPLSGPTSAQVRQTIEGLTGPLYEPQTSPGKFAQSVGEFVPAALAGPEGLAGRLVKQAVVPGLASEAAGQATEGTAAQPYARIAAAVAGGSAAGLVGGAKAAGNTIQEVKQAAAAGYKNPALDAVEFKPQIIDTLSNTITKSLDRSKLNDRIAGDARAVVEDLKNPINGTTHTLEDLRTTKSLLGDMAGELNNGKPTQNARAAAQAKSLIEKYIEAAPQAHVSKGDFPAASNILKTADADYAAGMTAERVSDKLRNADLRAASTYSGGNLNNATRQNLRTLLTSKKQGRGLTPDELQSIEDTVRGSTTGNVLRAAGKLLGGGGGLGAVGTGAAGHMLAGPLGLATPLVGYGIKKAGDAITRANSDKIVQQILARSPTGMSKVSAPPKDALNFFRQFLLANSASIPNRLPLYDFQAQQ
jgi:hypothetical protein